MVVEPTPITCYKEAQYVISGPECMNWRFV